MVDFSLGDGVTFPQRAVDEDMSSLLQPWPEDSEFHAPPFSSQGTSITSLGSITKPFFSLNFLWFGFVFKLESRYLIFEFV